MSFASWARKADHDKAYGKGFTEFFEKKLKELNDRHDDVNKRISMLRKGGKEVFFADVAAKQIKPKIKYFEASKSYDDYKRAALAIREAYVEINSIEPIRRQE
jgi:hypothetical protein